MKKKLFIFIGKPGVGKSTLVKAVFGEDKPIDVMPFVKAYEIDGIVPEEKTRDGYVDMYEYVSGLESENDIVIEVGTNHPDVNFAEIKKLRNKFNIIIFLCVASIDTCRERAIKRDRKMDRGALERRLEKNFPESHMAFIKKAKLKYIELDMERGIDENVNIIKKYISAGIV